MNKMNVKLASIITALFMALPIYAQMRDMGPGPDGPPPEFRDGPRRDFRGHHRHRRPPMCFGDTEFMREKLGLSDKQIELISSINLKYQRLLLENREKLQPQRTRLKQLLLEEKIDLAEIEKILKKISDVEVQIRLNRIKHRIEIEKVLTEEQRKKLREAKADRRGMPDDD